MLVLFYARCSDTHTPTLSRYLSLSLSLSLFLSEIVNYIFDIIFETENIMWNHLFSTNCVF